MKWLLQLFYQCLAEGLRVMEFWGIVFHVYQCFSALTLLHNMRAWCQWWPEEDIDSTGTGIPGG